MSDDAPPESPRTSEEAWNAVLSYLSYRSRSCRELERHLRRRGYEQDLVDRALHRCGELGLVDDRAFAAAFARDRIRLRPRGVSRLEAELLQKGVSREDAEAGIRAAFEDEELTELELLETTARRRWRRLVAADPSTARRRLFGHLARSGFPIDDVRRIVERLAKGGRSE
ncbi:MAG: RecX family transcriptional regulator [Gemmatimonadetes bacterium]|nr:RecX family transcriptional regulator [Gemmatimonadota bacterium]